MNVERHTLRGHHPGSPLYGGRVVSSSGSGSLLRKLTSLTKRSKSQPILNSARHSTKPVPSSSLHSQSQKPPPPTSTAQHLSPDPMALVAAQAASLKASATTSITTNAKSARPPSEARRRVTTTAPAVSPMPASMPPHSVAAGIAVSAVSAPLVVQVKIRFPSLSGCPVYTHEYASSSDVAVTNRLFKGLLRRLHHCSTELITRKDSRALKPLRRQADSQTTNKPLRYEIHFHLLRQDTGLWTERTYSSYQRQDTTSSDAHEIILATHCMVGLFLRRHDPSFHWTDGPLADTAIFSPRPEEPELVRHTVGHPLPLTCVPRSRFLEDSQSFEFTPGYAINLTFRSRCHGRKQYEWKRVINLQSKQNAPLSLSLAENLLWDTFGSINETLTARRETFLDEHKACDFLEGVVGCQHFGEDALDIELGVENKLGPVFDHLTRSIQSKLGLFRDPDARDCQKFFRAIHAQLLNMRDTVDARISALPDFDLRILTLCSPTWSVENPARFVLDTATSYSRRTVEAMLDRVQTGVSDVLRNRDCTIHLVAYKRGHLILDKALIARPLPPKPNLFPMPAVFEQPDTIVARLKDRIHSDLDAVCKDTCSLDGLSDSAGDEVFLANNTVNAAANENDALPDSPSFPLLVPGAFEQAIILQDPTDAREEEPTIPAPRVVELPDDVFVDALEQPQALPQTAALTLPTSASSRRRAFPLIPEKFALPHSRSSSGVTFVSAKQPTESVEGVVEEAPESAVLRTLPVETVDSAEAAMVAEPVSVGSTAETADVVEHVVEAAEGMGADELGQAVEAVDYITTAHAVDAVTTTDAIDTTAEELVEGGDGQVDVPVDKVEEKLCPSSQQCDVESVTEYIAEVEDLLILESEQPVVEDDGRAEPGQDVEGHSPRAAMPVVEDNGDMDIESFVKDDEKTSVNAYAIPGDGTRVEYDTTVPEIVEEPAQPLVFDAPPMFYTFDDSDSAELDNQPSVELRFDNVPTVGTQLDTIIESDIENADLAFDLPAYGDFLPPQKEALPLSETTKQVASTIFNDELANLAASETSFESAFEFAPESDVNEEPFVSSFAYSQNDHDESFITNTTAPTAVSPECTRPSTPSLSLSSGDLNSPQTSLLETPSLSREVHSGILSGFDSDGTARLDFGRAYRYDADSELDPSELSGSVGHVAQLQGDTKQRSDCSLASKSLFGQSLAVSTSLCHVDPVSESESVPTEIWPGTTENTPSPEIGFDVNTMGQLLKFDDDEFEPNSVPASPTFSCGLNFKDSFKEFAMTKPTVDLDEYADLVADDDAMSTTSRVDDIIDSILEDVVVDKHSQSHTGVEGVINAEPCEYDKPLQPDEEADDLHELHDQKITEQARAVEPHSELAAEPTIVRPISNFIARPVNQPADGMAITSKVEPEVEETEISFEQNVELETVTKELHSTPTVYFRHIASSVPLPESDDLELDIGHVVVSHKQDPLVTDEEPDSEATFDPVSELPSKVDVDQGVDAPCGAVAIEDLFVEAPMEETEVTLPAVISDIPLITAANEEHEITAAAVNEDRSLDAAPRQIIAEDTQDDTLHNAVEELQPPTEINADTNEDSELVNPTNPDVIGISEMNQDQTPVLQWSAPDDIVELGVVSSPVPIAQTLVDEVPVPIIPAEMKSLSFVSALRSAPLEQIVEIPGRPTNSSTFTDTCEETTCDSTDYITDFKETPAFPAPKHTISWSLPRAGHLGLDETRLIRVGLRSALTGSRAFDNIPFTIKKWQPPTPPAPEPTVAEEDGVLTQSSPECSPVQTHPVRREAVASKSELASSTTSKSTHTALVANEALIEDTPATTQDNMLPRVVIAFASMAIMSQMINRSS
ncbi:uncharacterized protein SPSK_05811 [Sporothrix schenckii 1099-18]|uniref:Pt repeat family protein n=1 Tax=Sporothrix schenckii 1099-18 TaxID=1397361 RepID=A0A0F2MLV7_SPOSC|nr:uncharacterized protein SPSK_05811 [Sporothrix schenckii 1099-18]KJR89835.1 hypothetical protein SPSK_05811 [Sporothrix schenckii 1099-18]